MTVTEPVRPEHAHETITCVVADDHPAVSELLGRYLSENEIVIRGTARDGRTAIALIEKHKPGIALVDLHMPHLGGIDVARHLNKTTPETAVILYTGFGDREQLLHALDAGVRGFIQKEAPVEEVLRAVRLVSENGIYIDPALASVLVSSEAAERLKTLTSRQREVLACIADGLTTDEVARTLFISPDTVRVHLRNAMDTLDADTRTHAVAKALRQSLIS
ncbi:MAG TPA: response regulator transcription factor [Gaiellaceae bacterium]|nr:response regulator transcription factor [Gaiellaceae bacterium]